MLLPSQRYKIRTRLRSICRLDSVQELRGFMVRSARSASLFTVGWLGGWQADLLLGAFDGCLSGLLTALVTQRLPTRSYLPETAQHSSDAKVITHSCRRRRLSRLTPRTIRSRHGCKPTGQRPTNGGSHCRRNSNCIWLDWVLHWPGTFIRAIRRLCIETCGLQQRTT